MSIALFILYAAILLVQASNVIYLRRNHAPPESSDGPAVSILVPARNEARNLRRLIPSVLTQDYGAFELIVYDDASDDGTPELLNQIDDARLRVLRGSGPPPGWLGKVYALHEAAKAARGDIYLFLDADAELLGPSALSRLVARHRSLGAGAVLTGFTDLRGGGHILVSVLPHTIISFLPAYLAERSSSPSLASLNGQCWMIEAETYRHLAPHEHVAGEVLEDVKIGRYLKRQGISPMMVNVRSEVAVYMYESFDDAWQGFRKNSYLLMGGSPPAFSAWFVVYGLLFVAAPAVHLPYLAAVYVLKFVSDRASGMPLWITLLAPVTHVAALALQLDSAVSHWTGRVSWKGRNVS